MPTIRNLHGQGVLTGLQVDLRFRLSFSIMYVGIVRRDHFPSATASPR